MEIKRRFGRARGEIDILQLSQGGWEVRRGVLNELVGLAYVENNVEYWRVRDDRAPIRNDGVPTRLQAGPDINSTADLRNRACFEFGAVRHRYYVSHVTESTDLCIQISQGPAADPTPELSDAREDATAIRSRIETLRRALESAQHELEHLQKVMAQRPE